MYEKKLHAVTIKIDDSTLELLHRLSDKREMSMGQYVRDVALEAHLSAVRQILHDDERKTYK